MGIDHTAPRPLVPDADLELALEEAIACNALQLHYQPKICLRSGGHCGVEALMRWYHPDYGAVPPDRFIPMAEKAGMIGALGDWAMNQCCALISDAQSRGVHAPRVAVNLSPLELLDEDLADRIVAVTRRHGVSPHHIELEITERAVISNPELATAVLERSRALGMTVAIDDFGTGYSSLAYLKRLPIDVLKLDRTFVAEIDASPVDRRIVRTVVALGHTLGLKVVAEGVERQEQADLLAKCRVDAVQGYFYARPMPSDALFQWLDQVPMTCDSTSSACRH